MKRRDFLTAAAASLSAVAGCTSDGAGDGGYTCTLALSEMDDESTDRLLDFDTADLAGGQANIVDEAVRSGSYSEEGVSWDSLPGRKEIAMEFRTAIRLIARHVGHDPQVDHETSFETPSRYERSVYRTTVEVV